MRSHVRYLLTAILTLLALYHFFISSPSADRDVSSSAENDAPVASSAAGDDRTALTLLLSLPAQPSDLNLTWTSALPLRPTDSLILLDSAFDTRYLYPRLAAALSGAPGALTATFPPHGAVLQALRLLAFLLDAAEGTTADSHAADATPLVVFASTPADMVGDEDGEDGLETWPHSYLLSNSLSSLLSSLRRNHVLATGFVPLVCDPSDSSTSFAAPIPSSKPPTDLNCPTALSPSLAALATSIWQQSPSSPAPLPYFLPFPPSFQLALAPAWPSPAQRATLASLFDALAAVASRAAQVEPTAEPQPQRGVEKARAAQHEGVDAGADVDVDADAEARVAADDAAWAVWGLVPAVFSRRDGGDGSASAAGDEEDGGGWSPSAATRDACPRSSPGACYCAQYGLCFARDASALAVLEAGYAEWAGLAARRREMRGLAARVEYAMGLGPANAEAGRGEGEGGELTAQREDALREVGVTVGTEESVLGESRALVGALGERMEGLVRAARAVGEGQD